MKGVAERGLGQGKSQSKREREEREEEKVRDTATATTKFRITTPNYLPMESTTHKLYIVLNEKYFLGVCVVLSIGSR